MSLHAVEQYIGSGVTMPREFARGEVRPVVSTCSACGKTVGVRDGIAEDQLANPGHNVSWCARFQNHWVAFAKWDAHDYPWANCVFVPLASALVPVGVPATAKTHLRPAQAGLRDALMLAGGEDGHIAAW